ncbi:diguanylate cyclase/phosphodiesterase (GGDEF & EAL domains) with PAS/PAC sensor(s) [hydrothermal vent metagenome]|uniref:Diguanylate cyclase/phosphodiesterase (GGDEF & EAL domains) with PAS/PAC sensor(S) n=1 Tax=hydrothermal vent metagenome TaxID=652676 RepID=A0A3B0YJ86_9ZZZZ
MPANHNKSADTRSVQDVDLDKYLRVIEQSAELVMITDSRGTIEYVNKSFELATGFRHEEVTGKTPRILKSGLQDTQFYDRLWTTLLSGKAFCDIVINRRKNGNLYYEEKTITPLRDPNTKEITHFISTGRDITQQINTDSKLRQIVNFNPLTGLPNRFLLKERFERALLTADKYNKPLALVVMDLDRFHKVNDTFGHETGDLILKQLANRLRKLTSSESILAHLGSDVFSLVFETSGITGRIPDWIQTFFEVLTPPFVTDDKDIYCSAALGISLYPQDGADVSTMLRNAETAMYRAKKLGPNSYQFYTSDMNVHSVRQFEMESALRRALERDEFSLHYQPQIDTNSGVMTGIEALLRWESQKLGLMMPNEFIPLLEETGLILPVGEWVIDTACRDLSRWYNTAGATNLRVAVNLSALQFQDPDLLHIIKSAVQTCRLPPHALELEITESVVMQDQKHTIQQLKILNANGFRLAIDDFGTGYSSLSYLKHFPVHTLKLAQPFVHGLPEDPGDVAITRAVIALAHNLGLEVVAEGVETLAQFEFLKTEMCDFVQGYLWSKPLPGKELEAILSDGTSFCPSVWK